MTQSHLDGLLRRFIPDSSKMSLALPQMMLLARSPHSAAQLLSDTRMTSSPLGFLPFLFCIQLFSNWFYKCRKGARRSQTPHPVSLATARSTGQDSTPGLGPWRSAAPQVSRLFSTAAATLSWLAPGSRGTQCLNRRGSDPSSVTSSVPCPHYPTCKPPLLTYNRHSSNSPGKVTDV